MSRANRFLSPAEFAELSGLSEATVRRRLKDGTIESVQPGGFRSRILIPIDALQRANTDDRREHAGRVGDVEESDRRTQSISGPQPKWMTETSNRI